MGISWEKVWVVRERKEWRPHWRKRRRCHEKKGAELNLSWEHRGSVEISRGKKLESHERKEMDISWEKGLEIRPLTVERESSPCARNGSSPDRRKG